MSNRIIIVITALLLCFCLVFSGCSSKDGTTTTAENNTSALSEDTSLSEQATNTVKLIADKTELSPGDEFTVVLNISGCPYFASIDASVKYDESAFTFVKYELSAVDGVNDSCSDLGSGEMYYAGYVATTINFANQNVMTLHFKVNDSAKSGSFIFTSDIVVFLIGTDKTGAETENITSKVSVSPVEVTVK